ncbi:hypothetical protein XENOCAPTIV_026931 [Xenoophorus captivus]|uniref:Uncharacterized protein n=1 Tax=Xenoophorus captivus TaxID=1517983 RepID=A0ABV0QBN1_9TELE
MMTVILMLDLCYLWFPSFGKTKGIFLPEHGLKEIGNVGYLLFSNYKMLTLNYKKTKQSASFSAMIQSLKSATLSQDEVISTGDVETARSSSRRHVFYRKLIVKLMDDIFSHSFS